MAVIVILAIIALIAVPIILNIIDNSKESSVLVSGKNYVRALEQQILSKNIKEKFSPEICIIQEDGNLICDGDAPFTVEVSGSKPTSGEIKFNNKKITEVIDMILDGYVLEMEIDKNLIVLGTIEEVLEPLLDPKGTYLMVSPSGSNADSYFLGQEEIKRNQVESITVTYTNKVPNNVIGSWDVSAAKDESIKAWYKDEDNNGLYELYIGGEGGVKANPNSSYLFYKFNNATTIDVSYLDTSDVTNMSTMFSNGINSAELDSKLTIIIGLNSFDTSNVTNMSFMFSGNVLLETLDLRKFDTNQVTNLFYMFSNCSSLTNLDVSNFNTSKVTDMSKMFSGCNKLTSLDLRKFDTSEVTNMTQMFQNCRSLTNLNLSSFDTSQVTKMGQTFYNCPKLETINLSNATFSNTTDYILMFDNVSKLATIYVKDVDAQTFINARLSERGITGVTVTIA